MPGCRYPQILSGALAWAWLHEDFCGSTKSPSVLEKYLLLPDEMFQLKYKSDVSSPWKVEYSLLWVFQAAVVLGFPYYLEQLSTKKFNQVFVEFLMGNLLFNFVM